MDQKEFAIESIFETLTSQLGGRALEQIAGQIGGGGVPKSAVPAAVGALMGALANNSSKRRGAEALHAALARDHDGSVLDDLPGYLSKSNAGVGAGILKHILGGQRSQVESNLGQKLGIDTGSAGQLLTMLAPLVMGAWERLGRAATSTPARSPRCWAARGLRSSAARLKGSASWEASWTPTATARSRTT